MNKNFWICGLIVVAVMMLGSNMAWAAGEIAEMNRRFAEVNLHHDIIFYYSLAEIEARRESKRLEREAWLSKPISLEDRIMEDVCDEMEARIVGGPYVSSFYNKNAPKMIHIWKDAADRGMAGGQYLYGNCLLQGAGGVVKNEKEAARLMQKAVDQGLVAAHEMLGYMYIHGKGVDMDNRKGLSLLYDAADEKYAPAEFGVAYYFEFALAEGIVRADAGTVRRDILHYYRRAAENGSIDAQMRLAGIHASGINGVKVGVDENEAKKWLVRAANAGHPQAKEIVSKWK